MILTPICTASGFQLLKNEENEPARCSCCCRDSDCQRMNSDISTFAGSLRRKYGAASTQCQLEKQHGFSLRPRSKIYAAESTTAQPAGHVQRRHGAAWRYGLRLVVGGHFRACCSQGAQQTLKDGLRSPGKPKLSWLVGLARWWPGCGGATGGAPLALVAAACPPPPKPSLTILRCSRHLIV